MTLEHASIAANRFGLGARPGDLAAISDAPHGWLTAQIRPEPFLPARLAALSPTAEDLGAFQNWVVSIGILPGAAAGGSLPSGTSVEQSFREVRKGFGFAGAWTA